MSVLLLAPSLRRAALGAVVAAGSVAVLFAPFALGGDFHMFSHQWHVTGGLMGAVLGDGHPFGWPLRLLQGGVSIAAAGTLARFTRRTTASIYAVPYVTVICRLVLDPMSISYYWDVATEIALIAAAAVLIGRSEVRAWLEARRARLPRTGYGPPRSDEELALVPARFWISGTGAAT